MPMSKFSYSRVLSLFVAVVIGSASFLMFATPSEAGSKRSGVRLSSSTKHYSRVNKNKSYGHQGKNRYGHQRKNQYGLRKTNRVNFGSKRSGVRYSGVNILRKDRKHYSRQHGVYIKPGRVTGVRGLREQRRYDRYVDHKRYEEQYRQKRYYEDEFYYTEVINTGKRPASKCPTRHNCGYRLYENGTGPRIIVPGVNDPDLPAQDGLNGPLVITLD